MNPSPFCNNLRRGDRAQIVSTGQVASVDRTPREISTGATVFIDGARAPRWIHVTDPRLIVDGAPEDVPPCDGEIPIPHMPIAPAAAVKPFEAAAAPVHMPKITNPNGSHLKHYLITWIDKAGEFHVQRVAHQGIVPAITWFYDEFDERAIVSVVCVL